MPPSAACLAKKGKRGPGGCRSLSRVNSGAALLTLRCRTLSLAVELHHVQRDTYQRRFVEKVHLLPYPSQNHTPDGLSAGRVSVPTHAGLPPSGRSTRDREPFTHPFAPTAPDKT